jgi:predicted nucleotidyltransferase
MAAANKSVHRRRTPDPSAGSATLLDALGVSASAERTVRYFATHPTSRPYVRELQRMLRAGGASAQRDLDRLTDIGALRRVEEGRLVRYAPELGSRFWRGIRLLISDPNDPASLLRDALCDVEGLQAAFVFGSSARGQARPDSDVDVFVVEDADVDRKALHRQLAEVAMLLDREVNPTRYTIEKLAERLGNRALPGARFVREVLTGPKEWVAGKPEALASVVLAAGIPFDRVKAE